MNYEKIDKYIIQKQNIIDSKNIYFFLQLHELLDELTKDNEQLQTKNEHCEYLTNVFNVCIDFFDCIIILFELFIQSITSEYDSGIELHIIDESPMSKRQKTHI